MDDSPLIFKSPEHFARHLFAVFVVEDESKFLTECDFSASRGFGRRTYERQKFVYLVAIIAIALTDAARTNKRFVDVLWHLRRMVRVEMQNRWNETNETSDSAVEEASEDCARLIFTPPWEDQALSLTWPQNWLTKCGVDEANPVTLFKIGYAWKEAYLTVAGVASRAQLEE